jgi:hypothetical protein
MGLEPTTSRLGNRPWIGNREFGVPGAKSWRQQVTQFQLLGSGLLLMEPFWSQEQIQLSRSKPMTMSPSLDVSRASPNTVPGDSFHFVRDGCTGGRLTRSHPEQRKLDPSTAMVLRA